MNNYNEIIKKVYLESLISESTENSDIEKKKVESPDPEFSPIDDLTKENTITIDEENENETETSELKKDEAKSDVEVEIQNEDGEELQQNNEENEEDGWPESMLEEENMSYLVQAIEDFTYELKNCTKGAYTNCKTKEELKNYMLNELIPMIHDAAENL